MAFLGPRPAAELAPIAGVLREAAEGGEPARLSLRGYRETRSVGMLTFDDENGRGAALAADLHARLEALGVYEQERRRWLPHVTVRALPRAPAAAAALPRLGAFVPSDAAVLPVTSAPRRGAVRSPRIHVELGGR